VGGPRTWNASPALADSARTGRRPRVGSSGSSLRCARRTGWILDVIGLAEQSGWQLHLPLKFSGPQPPVEIGDFAASALESHEHAVAVLVELTYFVCWPGERPRGIPRRLIPRPW
jgi:hypothetical protein